MKIAIIGTGIAGLGNDLFELMLDPTMAYSANNALPRFLSVPPGY